MPRALPCLLLAATLAHAAPPDIQPRLDRLHALRAQRPGDGLLVFHEASVLATGGRRDEALAALRSLLGRRLGLVPTKDLFEPLWDDAGFQDLRRRLADDEPATPHAPVAFTLSTEPSLMPEGIAYDPRSGTHFLGSVTQHRVVARDRHGRVRPVSSRVDDLDAVLGLAVAPDGSRLCAVSTNDFQDHPGKPRRNAIVCWSQAKASWRRVRRVDVPAATQLNDLAFARDGTLFTTDSAKGSLYRIGPRDRGAALVGDAGDLPGANGVAVAPDGAVYVGISTGVARRDPATGALARLPQPDDVATGGIDGLSWHDGALVGVQNVTNPGRVVRIALGEGGTRITGLAVLQSHHHPALDEPTTGAIAGDALHLVANSQMGRLRSDGSLEGAAPLAPPVVLAVPLRATAPPEAASAASRAQ